MAYPGVPWPGQDVLPVCGQAGGPAGGQGGHAGLPLVRLFRVVTFTAGQAGGMSSLQAGPSPAARGGAGGQVMDQGMELSATSA